MCGKWTGKCENERADFLAATAEEEGKGIKGIRQLLMMLLLLLYSSNNNFEHCSEYRPLFRRVRMRVRERERTTGAMTPLIRQRQKFKTQV